MIKIGMCDDNLQTLNTFSNFLESEIMQQNFNAEITLITTEQKKFLMLFIKKN